MKIDFLELLRASAEFSWRYKGLWIFGIILALFSGGGLNIPNPLLNQTDSSSIQRSLGPNGFSVGSQKQLRSTVLGFMRQPYLWFVLAMGLILVIVLIVVCWYLRRVAKIALINAAKHDQAGNYEKIKIGSLWIGTHPYLSKFFIFDLVWLIVGLPLGLVFVLNIVLFLINPLAGTGICCALIPVFFIFSILTAAVKETGERLMVLENQEGIESIKKGWHIVRKNFKEYILAWLTQLLPGCVFSFVVSTVSFVAMLPLVGLLLIVALRPTIAVIGLSVCIVLLVFLFLTCIHAPFVVFRVTYWTKFLTLLSGSTSEEKDSIRI